MKEIILVKYGELALKGLNRHTFEAALIKNIKKSIKNLGSFDVSRAQSAVFIKPLDDFIDMDSVFDRISKVFGIAGLSKSCVVQKDFNEILKTAAEYLKEQLEFASTFKVNAKRADKSFPLNSMEICINAGEYLLDKFPHLSVDVHNPEFTVVIEIRDFGAYIHGPQVRGAGGMPVGTAGNAALLISGGIDSPVAGYMMAKRGLNLIAVHFASPPYTSGRALIKVKDLLAQVSKYSNNIMLFTVPFTKIQELIEKNCQGDLYTIIMRRFMMRISEKIAQSQRCSALITGESLGQVASQTLKAMACTDNATSMPVFRPLIGMDKDEIVALSRKIDTFDISILPYEDCCTVFTPKHPRTRPILADVLKSEANLDIDALVDEAVNGVEKELITPNF
jgi:thiazole biosynthesis/tRNA modification protein ThiI